MVFTHAVLKQTKQQLKEDRLIGIINKNNLKFLLRMAEVVLIFFRFGFTFNL